MSKYKIQDTRLVQRCTRMFLSGRVAGFWTTASFPKGTVHIKEHLHGNNNT